VDNEDEGARLTWREENRELIAKHRVQMGTIPDAERKKVMEVHRLFESIVERATVEPRGCPTPGSCSAVAELADLKQRLLPQFAGRAQRAEHERDAMLEKLIVRQTTIANLHEEINGMRNAAPSATAAPVAWMYEEAGEKMFGHPDGYRPTSAVPLYAAPVEVAEPDRPDWARQLPGAELYDRAARYEYLRKLNPREFAALYDEALADERFDDLVDRYRDAEERPE